MKHMKIVFAFKMPLSRVNKIRLLCGSGDGLFLFVILIKPWAIHVAANCIDNEKYKPND